MSGKTKLEPSRRRSTPVKASADDYKISTEYLESLSKIYQDILAVFPKVDPRRYRGSGLAFQSIYSALDGKYTLAEIKLAAHELELGQAVELRNSIFLHPTDLGEKLIAALTGTEADSLVVEKFLPPPRA